MKRYSWKEHFPHRGVEAAVVHKALRGVERQAGKLTAPAVVAAATPPQPTLHPFFEWNNTKAGEAYRLEQARRLIRSVVVEIDDGDEHRALRAWPSYTPDDEPAEGARDVYVHVDVLKSDPIIRRKVLTAAWNELLAWKKRYENYEWFSREFSVIAKTIESKSR